MIVIAACKAPKDTAATEGNGNAPKAASLEMPGQAQTPPKNEAHKTANIEYKIIDGIEGTYGYDIFYEGKMLVHQPHIPGLPGRLGFTTPERAASVAKLLIEKIRDDRFGEGISESEMRELGAID